MTYSHVLTNQGNQAEGGTCSAMSFSGDNSLAGDGWTSVVYYDANNNGELDPSDPVVESLAQITASGSTPTAPPPWRARCLRAGSAPVRQGLRSVERGRRRNRQPHAAGHRQEQHRRRRLRQPRTGRAKRGGHQQRDDRADPAAQEQGLDAKCDGVVDLAFSATQIQVKPGECVIYRVQASNQGVDAVTNVIMNDSVPASRPTSTSRTRPSAPRVRPPRRPMAAPARSPATWVNSSLAPRPRCSSTSSWTTDRPFPFAWAQALASDSGGSRRSRLVIPKTLIRKD